jgi:hypothetical protein
MRPAQRRAEQECDMLGEKVGDETGRVVLRRVLPSDGGPPRVETTFEGTGKLLGVDIQDMGTYTSVMRPDGSLFGEGQGVIMSSTGEMATWKGQGVGIFNSAGGIDFRGAIYYQTQSPRFARLNLMAAVYEHGADASGAVKNEIWEWK